MKSKCIDCGEKLVQSVHQSAAGFYIGTWCNCGPYSRDSKYFWSRGEANEELFYIRLEQEEDAAFKALYG